MYRLMCATLCKYTHGCIPKFYFIKNNLPLFHPCKKKVGTPCRIYRIPGGMIGIPGREVGIPGRELGIPGGIIGIPGRGVAWDPRWDRLESHVC